MSPSMNAKDEGYQGDEGQGHDHGGERRHRDRAGSEGGRCLELKVSLLDPNGDVRVRRRMPEQPFERQGDVRRTWLLQRPTFDEGLRR